MLCSLNMRFFFVQNDSCIISSNIEKPCYSTRPAWSIGYRSYGEGEKSISVLRFLCKT